MSTEGPAIEVKGLRKTYGKVVALDGLDLRVEKGQLFGLLGPNGAGKSTLINVLSGLQSADQGSYSVLGYDLPRQIGVAKQSMGICPQSGAVFGHLTGLENVQLFGELYGLDKRKSKAKAEELLVRMGLNGEARRKASTYSEGMKRRLSVAMALVNSPRLAFLDEPTVAMDPQSRRAVWDFIKELKAQEHTVVLTTHYMEEAQQLCDAVGIIDHGQLIALGSPAELISKYGERDLEGVFIQLTGRRIREEV